MRIKNWESFQHYKDRSPPWIKLHKSLLDDYDFQCLPLASKALAPMLWLLASENMNGNIDDDPKRLAFRLRWCISDVLTGLKPLIEKGFVISASDVLASCYHDATHCTADDTEASRKPDNPTDASLTCNNKRQSANQLIDLGFSSSASDVLASCYQSATPETETETETEAEAEKTAREESQEKLAQKKQPAAKQKFDAAAHLAAEGVPDAVAADWLEMRKTRRAVPTLTAINGLKREAKKAGLTLAATLALCCERGWTGFCADWAGVQQTANQRRQSPASNREAKEAAWGSMMRDAMGGPRQAEIVIEGEIVGGQNA